jgi:hypothetical protein
MVDIMNIVVLNFFDRSLKGKPASGELFTDIPEVVVRHHSVDARKTAMLSN